MLLATRLRSVSNFVCLIFGPRPPLKIVCPRIRSVVIFVADDPSLRFPVKGSADHPVN